jgi:cytochrome b subunit of formate dehydrogenase
MSKQVKDWVHHLLTVSTFLFVVSGIGITEYNLMNLMTFGLLTKDRSYLLHTVLLYPFTALLFLHIYYKMSPRFITGKGSQREK